MGPREKVVMSQGCCTANRAEFTQFERLIHHHRDNCLRALAATWFLYLLQCYAKQPIVDHQVFVTASPPNNLLSKTRK
jgi:hypothetical protein